MIVGVKPFGHFERWNAMRMGAAAAGAGRAMGLAFRSSRQGEVGRKRDLAAVPAVSVRYGAHHDARVQHVIV